MLKNNDNKPYLLLLIGIAFPFIIASLGYLFLASTNSQSHIAVIEKECEINHDEIDRCRNEIHKIQGQ